MKLILLFFFLLFSYFLNLLWISNRIAFKCSTDANIIIRFIFNISFNSRAFYDISVHISLHVFRNVKAIFYHFAVKLSLYIITFRANRPNRFMYLWVLYLIIIEIHILKKVSQHCEVYNRTFKRFISFLCTPFYYKHFNFMTSPWFKLINFISQQIR